MFKTSSTQAEMALFEEARYPKSARVLKILISRSGGSDSGEEQDHWSEERPSQRSSGAEVMPALESKRGAPSKAPEALG